MKLDIYKSSKAGLYVAVPEGTDVSAPIFTPEDAAKIGLLSGVVAKTVLLKAGLVAFDEDEVADGIKAKGYCLISVSVGP